MTERTMTPNEYLEALRILSHAVSHVRSSWNYDLTAEEAMVNIKARAILLGCSDLLLFEGEAICTGGAR